MIKIGLTGGIACGKTTVSNYLRQLGAKVIDADKIVHQLLSPNQILWKKYCNHFGKEILNEDSTINKEKVGKIIFSNPKERKWIFNECHNCIYEEIKKQEEKLAKEKVIFLDIPLLFETGWENKVDKIWVVYLDKKTQLKRLMNRNNFTFSQAKNRIRSQWPLTKKLLKADNCINNSYSKDKTKRKVKYLWQKIQNV